MSKRKILSLAMALSIVAIMAVGATLAYFTDTDEAMNVFSVGNVKIDMHEEERSPKATDGSYSIQDFTDGKTLMPIVGSAQGTKDKYGMPVAANYLDKIVTVENTGNNDAYIRVFVGIPKYLVDFAKDGYTNDSDNAVHLSLGNRYDATGASSYNNGPALEGWPWNYGEQWVGDMVIGGETYYVECYTMTEKLAKATTSRALLAGVYMDSAVDYDAESGNYLFTCPTDKNVYTILGSSISNGITVPVFAQAVQVDGFESAEAAFQAAGMNDATGAPLNPWAE